MDRGCFQIRAEFPNKKSCVRVCACVCVCVGPRPSSNSQNCLPGRWRQSAWTVPRTAETPSWRVSGTVKTPHPAGRSPPGAGTRRRRRLTTEIRGPRPNLDATKHVFDFTPRLRRNPRALRTWGEGPGNPGPRPNLDAKMHVFFTPRLHKTMSAASPQTWPSGSKKSFGPERGLSGSKGP